MIEVRVSDDPAQAAAVWIVERLREAVAARGRATIAVSGGSTAPPMFDAMLRVGARLDWSSVSVWQVDERVAPDGDDARNAAQLDALRSAGADVRPMPVTSRDLDAAARDYAAGLPERFDVVHLGLGADGHTASWPPDDDAPVRSDDRVTITSGEFNGYRRMTLTPPVVNAAPHRAMLTLGADKREVVERWLSGDRSIPAAHLTDAGTVAFVDPAAAPAR